MKAYVIIATALSALFGAMPLYLAKISGMDGEACDTEIWYEAGECVIKLGRGLFTFGLYFGIAIVFFIALAVAWLVWSWVMDKLWSR